MSNILANERDGECRPWTEWKIVAFLLVAILGLEIGMRAIESKLSIDLLHQTEIPTIFVDIKNATGPRVMFLGNSLVRESVDIEAFETVYGEQPLTVAKSNPDNTSVVEWRYLFADAVAGEKLPADLVVIGYAEDQLSDNGIVKPRRLGVNYLKAETQAEIWSSDVTSFSDRSELLLAALLHSFAHSERVRTRVLEGIIPMYRGTAQRLNGATPRSLRRSNAEGESPERTYKRFDQIVQIAKERSLPIALVAIPVGDAYELDGAFVEDCQSRGILHIDARNVDGIKAPDNFLDG